MSQNISNFSMASKISILEQQLSMNEIGDIEDKFIVIYKKIFEDVKSYFYWLKDQTLEETELTRFPRASASDLPSIFSSLLKNCSKKDKDEIKDILKNHPYMANLSFCELIFCSLFDVKDELPGALHAFIEKAILTLYFLFRFGVDPKAKILDLMQDEKNRNIPFIKILHEIYNDRSAYESTQDGIIKFLQNIEAPLKLCSLNHQCKSKKTLSRVQLFLRVLEANRFDNNNTLFNQPLAVYQECIPNIENLKELVPIFSFCEALLKQMPKVPSLNIKELVELVSDVKNILQKSSLLNAKNTKSQKKEYHRVILALQRLYLTYVKDYSADVFKNNLAAKELLKSGDTSKKVIGEISALFTCFIYLRSAAQAFDCLQNFLSKYEESCIEEHMQFLNFTSFNFDLSGKKNCIVESWQINGICLDSVQKEVNLCSLYKVKQEIFKEALAERMIWSNWDEALKGKEKNDFSELLNFFDDICFSSKPKGSDFESYDLKISHHPLRLRLIYKIFLEKADMNKFSLSLKSLLDHFHSAIEEIEKTRVTQEIKISFQKKLIQSLSPLVFECICYNFAKEIWLYPQSDETESVFPDELLSLLNLQLKFTEEASTADVSDTKLNLSADLELSETTIQKTALVAQKLGATTVESSSKASASTAKAASSDSDDALEKEEQLQKLRRLRKLNDICKVLKYLGYKQESSKRGKGSHAIWAPETGGQGKVVVPHHYELAKGTVHSIADTVEKSLQLK